MSRIEEVGKLVAGFRTEADGYFSELYGVNEKIQLQSEYVRHLLQSTRSGNYQDIINQMNAAQKAIKSSMDSLMAASLCARDWLTTHIAGGGSSGVSSLINSDSTTLNESASTAYSQNHSTLSTMFDQASVSYREIQVSDSERSSDDIIDCIGGGDLTEGSCSSLAFAYAGSIAGYEVLDFRGGRSRELFSKNSTINLIAGIPGIDAVIEYGKDDVSCADKLLSQMIPGKEYYLATGEHAAIVRTIDGHNEYLELQHPTNNGWFMLTDQVLYKRFGCTPNDYELPNFLIDVESLAGNQEFLDLLGYLNTAELEQYKGDEGYER